MDETVDVLLVGPWDRVLAERGEKGIRDYVGELKLKKFIGKVIYSSSDPLGVVPVDIFDDVVSTYRGERLPNAYVNANTSYATSRTKWSPYIENVKAGLEFCTAKFIIRVRSDLELSELDSIHLFLVENPENIYIDYHPEHALLIPFYFSDMFLAAKATNVRSLYNGSFERNAVGRKKLSFSPFKYLNAGFWDESYQYPELLFWSNGLCNLGYITNSLRVSSNVVSFIKSLGLIDKKIILFDRNRIFNLHPRFNNAHGWGDNVLFPWKLKVYSRLVIKHFFQFLYKTLTNLMGKWH